MEKVMDWEQRTLINELTQGKELVNELRNHLNPASSPETRQFLVEKILSSYEKALTMLNWGPFVSESKPSPISILESPHTFENSRPKSDISDQDFKVPCSKDVLKKRKTQHSWTEQVRVCSGTGLEGPLVDGYSWRKYGQKDILGANFPRGYYRCTHRHSQGCLATKQVQRSDEDSAIFEVTYKGRHTCNQASHLAMASTINDWSNENKDNGKRRRQEKPKPSKDVFSDETGELDKREEIFPSFPFLGSEIGNEIAENDIFTESMESDFLGGIAPAFISPATSESNYFSMSPRQMNDFGIGYNVQTPESVVTDIFSAPTSVTNSPIGDLDISNMDFNSSFPFDNMEFFA